MVVRAGETSPALGEASRGCGDLFYLKAGLVVLNSRNFSYPLENAVQVPGVNELSGMRVCRGL